MKSFESRVWLTFGQIHGLGDHATSDEPARMQSLREVLLGQPDSVYFDRYSKEQTVSSMLHADDTYTGATLFVCLYVLFVLYMQPIVFFI
jgi:hypothetical protein